MTKRTLNLLFFLAFLALFTFASAQAYGMGGGIGAPTSALSVIEKTQIPDTAYPGDSVTLRVGIQNPSTQQYLTSATVIIASPFDTAYKTTFNLGDFQPLQVKSITFTTNVTGDTKPGNYKVFLYAQTAQESFRYLGEIPLVVSEPVVSNAFVLRLSAPELYPGESAAVNVSVTDVAAYDTQDVVLEAAPNASSPITVLGYSRVSLGNVKAGEERTTRLTFAIGANSAPGYYTLPLSVYYKVNRVGQPTLTQNLGLRVSLRPSVLVTSTLSPSAIGPGSPATMSLTVANTGDSPLRAVHLSLQSHEVRAAEMESFVGSLNVDDSNTFSTSISPAPGVAPGEYEVVARVYYTDYLNHEHTAEKRISVRVAASGELENARAGGRRPGGTSGLFLGLSLLEWTGVLGMLILAYLGYRYLRRRGKR